MSDLNGGGVLHLVSELKVTGFEKRIFENYFQKGFEKEVFSKVKLILRNIVPEAIYLSFDPLFESLFPSFSGAPGFLGGNLIAAWFCRLD